MEEFVLLFAISLVFRVGIDLFFDLLLMKDAAEMGYKFKKEEFDRVDKELNDSKNNVVLDKVVKLINLIPVVNVLVSFYNGLKSQVNKEFYLKMFSFYDALDNLNKMEENVFLNDPTMVNAYKINNDLLEVSFCWYKSSGKIYYYIDDSDVCYIIKAEGDALKLSLFEQIDYVRNDISKNMPCDIKKRIRKK